MRYAKWIAIVVAVIAAGGGVYYYWRHKTLYPSTEDAYVQADVVYIAPQVTGKVMDVPVHDHEHVAPGQVLLEIDPDPFRIAFDQALAKRDLAHQQALAADAAVHAARAVVAQRRAEFTQAEANARRISRLYKRRTAAKSLLDQAVAARDADRAAVKQAQAQLHQSQQQQAAAKAAVQVAQTAVQQARLDLSYTRIAAPASGELGSVGVKPGAVVSEGEDLMPLVEDGTFYVSANFKETELPRIQPGQPAKVQVDLYPGGPLRGRVASISPASGAAFSLLPPENATGNWVKVTQRFPVRIHILTQRLAAPLRVGASSTVTVDTTGAGTGGRPHAVAENAHGVGQP